MHLLTCPHNNVTFPQYSYAARCNMQTCLDCGQSWEYKIIDFGAYHASSTLAARPHSHAHHRLQLPEGKIVGAFLVGLLCGLATQLIEELTK